MKPDRDKAASLLWLQALDWGVGINEEQLNLLTRYADLIAGYELANVIGAKSSAEVLLAHVADALSCFITQQLGAGKSLIDVGTGGGLPGIPLKIVCSDLRMTLLEATTKKSRFLEQVKGDLSLTDTKIVNNRAEELGRTRDFRDSFDVAVTRALGTLPVVLEYCAPLVNTGGLIIAMKGRPQIDEMRNGHTAAQALGLEYEEKIQVDFRAEMVQKDRTLLLFRKNSTTPSRFPRRVGLAKHRPLGETGQD